jgi:HSP20 family protein
MTNIIKRDNGRQPATFGSVVDQIFQNNLNRFFDDSFWGHDGSFGRTQVPVNIRETETSYEMELVAPGLKKQDFNLQVAGDMLTVSFEHKQENRQENKQEGWLRQEYKKQSFTRSFNLDATIDAAKIEGRYEDGVLTLVLPKKESAQKVARVINVQ